MNTITTTTIITDETPIKGYLKPLQVAFYYAQTAFAVKIPLIKTALTHFDFPIFPPHNAQP